MIKVYQLSGMKCQGCVKTVTERLSGVLGVRDVKVDLGHHQVTVTGYALPFLLKRALKGTRFQLSKFPKA